MPDPVLCAATILSVISSGTARRAHVLHVATRGGYLYTVSFFQYVDSTLGCRDDDTYVFYTVVVNYIDL